MHQCSKLLEDTVREDFFEELTEEYEELRHEHYDSLKVRRRAKTKKHDLKVGAIIEV